MHKPREVEDAIELQLSQVDPMSWGQMFEALEGGMSKAQVRRGINRLEKKGKVVTWVLTKAQAAELGREWRSSQAMVSIRV